LCKNDSIGYVTRAHCFIKLNLYEETIKDFTKAIEINPEFMNFYKQRAELYEKISESELAKQDIQKTWVNKKLSKEK